MNDRKLTESSNESDFTGVLTANVIWQIPHFQRTYVWNRHRVSALIDDVIRIKDDEDSAHFIGAFIVTPIAQPTVEKRVYNVIDGQQRITTIYIILAAIIKTLLKNGNTDVARDKALNCLFIREKGDLQIPRLVPSFPDRDSFASVIRDLLTSKINIISTFINIPSLIAPSSKGLIWDNYHHCCNKTDAIYKNEGEVGLESFYEAVLLGLKVIQIQVLNPMYGPQIFDSLNSKQESITAGDLVRNEVFSRSQESDANSVNQLDTMLWRPFYESFNHPKTQINMFEKYLFPYGLIENYQLKKYNLFNDLRKQWTQSTSDQVITSLNKYVNEYQDLVFGLNKCQAPPPVAEAVLRLHRLPAPSVALPFLMKVSHEIRMKTCTPETGVELLKAVESFLVRRALCGIEPTGLHAVFKRLWHTLNERQIFSAQEIEKIISETATVTVPTDDTVFESFEKKLYGKSIAKFFLFEYDKSLGGDVGEFDNMQIEHVLPQKLSENWSTFSSEDHSLLKDRAGNLVPLTSIMNNQVGQDPYLAKAARFAQASQFKSARVLADSFVQWTPETIQQRTSQMADWALTRWKFQKHLY